MDKIWYILTYLIVNALDLGVTAKYMNFFLGKLKVQKNRAGICQAFLKMSQNS